MKEITKEEKEILDELMREKNLTPESKLYRYTSEKYLTKVDGQLFLDAKEEPVDMVIDRYHGYYHAFLGKEIGQGLSFMKVREKEYERDDRVCVELTLKDVLDQGGLVYSVSSLPAHIKGFFFTLPEGKVNVKQL